VSAEVEQWKFRDPIQRLKTYLSREGWADDAFFTRVDEEADSFAAELRHGCITMATPPGETMWDHIYAEEHPVMEAERAAFVAYQASFEEVK
jgi:pyruvate dehydrogenase E1 component alpha subunit